MNKGQYDVLALITESKEGTTRETLYDELVWQARKANWFVRLLSPEHQLKAVDMNLRDLERNGLISCIAYDGNEKRDTFHLTAAGSKLLALSVPPPTAVT